MCGRARLSSDVSEIKLVFRIPPERPTPNIAPSWNVAPPDPLPVVRYDERAQHRSLDVMRWGLIPYWGKDIKIGFSTINARAEEAYGAACSTPVELYCWWSAAMDRPQLTELVDEAPNGPQWLHEIKFDGYRMHARLDRGSVRLLTRSGLDWTHKYQAIAAAVSSLAARQAYLNGELCGVGPAGITSFSMIQLASDVGNATGLVFFRFDLLYLDGEDIAAMPLTERRGLPSCWRM